jgi:hypothetical protein
MTQLSQRTDRVLPNGVCLLPPLKSCDKGNACFRATQSRPPHPAVTVTQASLDALATHTRKRRDIVRARIEKALRDLRRQNVDITISSVSRRAGVTRKSIYRRDDLVALIRAHRQVTAVPDDHPPPDTETSIIAALRARLTAKDTQIAQLKADLRERDRTIAALHGELDKRNRTTPS